MSKRICTALMVLAMPCLALAGMFTLVDGDTTANLDTDSEFGIESLMSQATDHLFQHWFWYRIGPSGPEIPVTTLTMQQFSESLPASNSYSGTFSATGVTFQINITLEDDPAGDNTVRCQSTLSVQNTNAVGDLDLHLFAYTDFDLNDSIDDAWVRIDSNGAVQAIAGIVSRETLSPAADAFSVAIYPDLVDLLNDGFPNNFTNSDSLGPADNTYAHQWNISLAPSESFDVDIVMEVTPTTNFTITALDKTDTETTLTWWSNPVEYYTVEVKTNLLDPNWIAVPGMTSMPGDVGAMSVVIDTNAPVAYYRIVSSDAP